jgi:hypothetical protein
VKGPDRRPLGRPVEANHGVRGSIVCSLIPRSAATPAHPATSLDQIQYPPTKLRRITPSPHAVLLRDSSIRVQPTDSTNPGHITLHCPWFVSFG